MPGQFSKALICQLQIPLWHKTLFFVKNLHISIVSYTFVKTLLEELNYFFSTLNITVVIVKKVKSK